MFSTRGNRAVTCPDPECRREAIRQRDRQRNNAYQEAYGERRTTRYRRRLTGPRLEAERVRQREASRRAGWTESRKASTQRRRALKRQLPAEWVRPSVIYYRDGWRCHICQQSIDCDLAYPHPQSASLDHVIPLVAGGSHTALNLRAAHLQCNMRKGSSVKYDQLELIV